MGIVNKKKAILKEAVKRGLDPKFWSYRLMWNCYPRFGIVHKVPLHIDLELTNTCNLKCIMCVHGQEGIKNQGFMEIGFAKDLVRQAGEMGVTSMKFNWRGEATLHKGLPELIRYAKNKGIIEVQLNTNGTLLTDKLIEDLIVSGLDRIIFSLDSVNKTIYEKIRIGANFEKVMGSVVKMHDKRNGAGSKKPFIRVQMTRMKGNEHEEEEFIQKWRPYTDEIRISDATDRGQGRGMLITGKVSVGRVLCTQPWQRMAISWDGKAYPCCADYFEKWPIGNAREEKLADIWKGRKMALMRQEQKNMRLDRIQPCKSCFWSGSFKWKKIS